MPPKPKKLTQPQLESEGDIQRTVLDYLKLHRVMHWRNNSGKVRVKGGFIKLSPTGSPDIFALVNGKLWGIEVKKPTERQSPEQRAFQTSLEAAGGRYVVARSLQDVIDAGIK